MTENPMHPGKNKHRELFEAHHGVVKVLKEKKMYYWRFSPCYKTQDDFCVVWEPKICGGECHQVNFNTLVRCLEQDIPINI